MRAGANSNAADDDAWLQSFAVDGNLDARVPSAQGLSDAHFHWYGNGSNRGFSSHPLSHTFVTTSPPSFPVGSLRPPSSVHTSHPHVEKYVAAPRHDMLKGERSLPVSSSTRSGTMSRGFFVNGDDDDGEDVQASRSIVVGSALLLRPTEGMLADRHLIRPPQLLTAKAAPPNTVDSEITANSTFVSRGISNTHGKLYNPPNYATNSNCNLRSDDKAPRILYTFHQGLNSAGGPPNRPSFARPFSSVHVSDSAMMASVSSGGGSCGPTPTQSSATAYESPSSSTCMPMPMVTGPLSCPTVVDAYYHCDPSPPNVVNPCVETATLGLSDALRNFYDVEKLLNGDGLREGSEKDVVMKTGIYDEATLAGNGQQRSCGTREAAFESSKKEIFLRNNTAGVTSAVGVKTNALFGQVEEKERAPQYDSLNYGDDDATRSTSKKKRRTERTNAKSDTSTKDRTDGLLGNLNTSKTKKEDEKLAAAAAVCAPAAEMVLDKTQMFLHDLALIGSFRARRCVWDVVSSSLYCPQNHCMRRVDLARLADEIEGTKQAEEEFKKSKEGHGELLPIATTDQGIGRSAETPPVAPSNNETSSDTKQPTPSLFPYKDVTCFSCARHVILDKKLVVTHDKIEEQLAAARLAETSLVDAMKEKRAKKGSAKGKLSEVSTTVDKKKDSQKTQKKSQFTVTDAIAETEKRLPSSKKGDKGGALPLSAADNDKDDNGLSFFFLRKEEAARVAMEADAFKYDVNEHFYVRNIMANTCMGGWARREVEGGKDPDDGGHTKSAPADKSDEGEAEVEEEEENAGEERGQRGFLEWWRCDGCNIDLCGDCFAHIQRQVSAILQCRERAKQNNEAQCTEREAAGDNSDAAATTSAAGEGVVVEKRPSPSPSVSSSPSCTSGGDGFTIDYGLVVPFALCPHCKHMARTQEAPYHTCQELERMKLERREKEILSQNKGFGGAAIKLEEEGKDDNHHHHVLYHVYDDENTTCGSPLPGHNSDGLSTIMMMMPQPADVNRESKFNTMNEEEDGLLGDVMRLSRAIQEAEEERRANENKTESFSLPTVGHEQSRPLVLKAADNDVDTANAVHLFSTNGSRPMRVVSEAESDGAFLMAYGSGGGSISAACLRSSDSSFNGYNDDGDEEEDNALAHHHREGNSANHPQGFASCETMEFMPLRSAPPSLCSLEHTLEHLATLSGKIDVALGASTKEIMGPKEVGYHNGIGTPTTTVHPANNNTCSVRPLPIRLSPPTTMNSALPLRLQSSYKRRRPAVFDEDAIDGSSASSVLLVTIPKSSNIFNKKGISIGEERDSPPPPPPSFTSNTDKRSSTTGGIVFSMSDANATNSNRFVTAPVSPAPSRPSAVTFAKASALMAAPALTTTTTTAAFTHQFIIFDPPRDLNAFDIIPSLLPECVEKHSRLLLEKRSGGNDGKGEVSAASLAPPPQLHIYRCFTRMSSCATIVLQACSKAAADDAMKVLKRYRVGLQQAPLRVSAVSKVV